MNTSVIIATSRDAYSIADIRRTMTVADFIACLEQFDEDAPVYLSFDNGYTYGGITEECLTEIENEEEE